jgi:hypothetical protein
MVENTVLMIIARHNIHDNKKRAYIALEGVLLRRVLLGIIIWSYGSGGVGVCGPLYTLFYCIKGYPTVSSYSGLRCRVF